MATKLFLRSTQNNGVGAGYFDMVTAAGAATATGVVNTAASGTEIQWTQTAGGAVLQFISGRAPAGGFTLTSTDISVWAAESNAQANAGGRFRVFKRAANGTETELGGGPFNDGVEFGTSAAEMTWIGNVTDTAFAEDDRILLKLYITNVGTMGGSRTCTLTYNGADAATGDSFLNIAETVAFKSEAQSANLGVAGATDSALAQARTEARALAAVAEAGSANSLARAEIKALAPATAADAAQPPSRVEARAIGVAGETGTALSIMPMIGVLGVAGANDNALPLARSESVLVGAASEIAAAPPLARSETKAIGVEDDTATAQPLSRAEALAIGIANETCAADQLARVETIALAATTETAAALPFAAPQAADLVPTLEQAAGLALATIEVRTIGLASSNDNALALTWPSTTHDCGTPTCMPPRSVPAGVRPPNVSRGSRWA